MILEIVLYILASAVIWFLWLVIHEMSHIAGAFLVSDVTEWSIKPYPNQAEDGHWRFASATWRWKEVPSDKKRAFTSLAPRIPNLLAIALIPFTLLLTGVAHMLLLIFCAGGVVGLIVGSMGQNDNSDLSKAAAKLKISKWYLRIPGFVVAAGGAAMVLYSFFSTILG